MARRKWAPVTEKRIAAYVRVSTLDQHPENQERELRAWLKAHGHDPRQVDWYEDAGISGETTDRPGLQELRDSIFQGDVDTVITWKLDRLSRKLRDGIEILADWTDRGVRVVATTQNLDFSGAVGKLLASVFLCLGEIESEHRRERQRAGINRAKAEGRYRGRAKGTIVGDPALVRELRAKGLSWSQCAAAAGVSTRTARRYAKMG